jgi:hypothetical protein
MFTSSNAKAHVKEQLLGARRGIGKFRNDDIGHGF